MDDRDRRKARPPPTPIADQLAPDDVISWDDDTPTPASVPDAIEQVKRRQKQTQETSQTTLDRVDKLRAELRSDIRDVDVKVDGLAAHVGGLAVSSAEVSGQLGVLVKMVERDREERSTIKVEAARASIEVRKTGEIATIQEGRARNDHRRQLVLKGVAAVGAVWALVSAMLLSRGCP